MPSWSPATHWLNITIQYYCDLIWRWSSFLPGQWWTWNRFIHSGTATRQPAGDQVPTRRYTLCRSSVVLSKQIVNTGRHGNGHYLANGCSVVALHGFLPCWVTSLACRFFPVGWNRIARASRPCMHVSSVSAVTSLMSWHSMDALIDEQTRRRSYTLQCCAHYIFLPLLASLLSIDERTIFWFWAPQGPQPHPAKKKKGPQPRTLCICTTILYLGTEMTTLSLPNYRSFYPF